MSNPITAAASVGIKMHAATPTRRKSITIRTTLITILSTLVAGLLVLAVINMLSAWDRMQSAQAMRSNNETGV